LNKKLKKNIKIIIKRMRNNKFWFENMNCLFYEHHFLPSEKMSLESKMNSITRFVIFIFIVLVFLELFNMKNNILFLVLSLFIIIILYYKQKNQMIENFEDFNIGGANKNTFTQPVYESTYNNVTDTPTRNCNTSSSRINYKCARPDDQNVTKITYFKNKMSLQNNFNSKDYNPNFIRPTDNQILVGGPNPKTLVPPVIPVPAMDIDYWRQNDRNTISTINAKKNRYDNDSGYKITADIPINYSNPQNFDCKSKQKRSKKKYGNVGAMEAKLEQNKLKSAQEENKEIKENFEFPYEINSKSNHINTEDSFYYKDFKNNPYFKDKYKENIFKEIITPGKYQINERNEPINSNIGISVTQTFPDDEYEVIEPFENVNMSNVYDPRFHGYGTSYRGYFDKNVGQPRFYYDDINAVKMPNYITRNHIDVTPFGDAYGAIENEGNKYNSNIHALADKHYNDSMMQFRDEMQSRLMRKVNSEHWQQKMYPIHKHSQRN
jgi:hypothetical protein